MSTPHSTEPSQREAGPSVPQSRPGAPGAEPGSGQDSGSSGGQATPAEMTGQVMTGRPMTGRPMMSRAEASGAWPAFLAAGLAALVVGVLLLAWPSATLTLVAILIGISLIVAGLLRLTAGFTGRRASAGSRTANIMIGLLAMVVGLYCLRYTSLTITWLAVIVGIFWVIHGIADLAVGFAVGPFPGRGLTITTGVLSVAAGLIVMFWPTISITVLVAVIGIWLIVYGILLAVMAMRLRRSSRSASGGPGPMVAA